MKKEYENPMMKVIVVPDERDVLTASITPNTGKGLYSEDNYDLDFSL